MKKKNKWLYVFLLSLVMVGVTGVTALAAPSTVDLPSVNIDIGGSGSSSDYVSNIKLLIFFTILSLLPAIIIMVLHLQEL